MHKLIFINSIFLIFSFSYFSFAQPLVFSGTTVFYKGNSLEKEDLKKILTTNPHAYQLHQNAHRFHSVGNAFQVAGVAISAVLLVRILTTDTQDQNINLSFLYGTPIYSLGSLFKWIYKKNLKGVVQVYNNGLSKHLEKDERPNYNLGLTQNGVGFIINF